MPTTGVAGVRVTPGEPRLILCSPPGEERWGFYQFPDVVRTPGGDIVLAINVGCDCDIGRHDPSIFFVSRDNGASWRQAPLEDVDMAPQIVTFSDGSQVALGASAYIYHVIVLAHPQAWMWWDPRELGIDPLPGVLNDSYGHSQYVLYRYQDIPGDLRAVPAAWRAAPDAPWESGSMIMDDPEMLLCCLAHVRWWDDDGNEIREPQMKRLMKPFPREVVLLPDDTLLWAQYSTHPASYEKGVPFFCVTLYASTDKGRTWQKRGMVADNTELTTDGYSGDEHEIRRMPNGDLYCVMRTEMGSDLELSRYLAAARSTDNGATWSVPEAIAPFSVTPHLLVLENGMAAVVYGRPGVYVRASADSGHTWTVGLPIVGPPENELLRETWWAVPYAAWSGDKISCGNLGAVATGPDRFLLAYSDFRHRNENGDQCKAIFVQEFVVEPE